MRLTSRITLSKLPWAFRGVRPMRGTRRKSENEKKKKWQSLFPWLSHHFRTLSSMAIGAIHWLAFHCFNSDQASVFLFLTSGLKVSTTSIYYWPWELHNPLVLSLILPTQTSITSLFISYHGPEWYSSLELKFLNLPFKVYNPLFPPTYQILIIPRFLAASCSSQAGIPPNPYHHSVGMYSPLPLHPQSCCCPWECPPVLST